MCDRLSGYMHTLPISDHNTLITLWRIALLSEARKLPQKKHLLMFFLFRQGYDSNSEKTRY